jgi:hypothetical protein
MDIYIIRYRTFYKDKTQNYDEQIIINNLVRSREIYNDFLKHCKEVDYLDKWSGFCHLFKPYIFENGELAYWPDNDEYIEKYEF